MSALEDTFLWQIEALHLPAPVREFRFDPKRQFRADLAFTAARLLIEVDGGTWSGGRHTTGMGIEGDAEKQSTAASLGYRTMRVTRKLIESGRALALLEAALAWKPE